MLSSNHIHLWFLALSITTALLRSLSDSLAVPLALWSELWRAPYRGAPYLSPVSRGEYGNANSMVITLPRDSRFRIHEVSFASLKYDFCAVFQ